MRMFFLPEETGEFEVGRDLLSRRCERWARAWSLTVDAAALSWALDCRHHSVDGRLGFWTRQVVRDFLLDWIPRHVSASPRELRDTPETLRTLLRYLDHTGLLDPASASMAELETAVSEAAREFDDAVADESRFGMAKFWTMRAMAEGVDPSDGDALTRFSQQATVDQDVLNHITQRHMLDGGGNDQRMPPLPPVSLPDPAAASAAASESALLRRVCALAEWVGDGQRPLTKTGALKLADARTLVESLDTGDGIDPVIGERTFRTQSSTELGHLMLVLTLAKKARLVRVVKNNLVRVAKNQWLRKDPDALWQRLFTSLITDGEAVFPDDRPLASVILAAGYAETMPDVLNTLYGMPEPMPVVRLEEPIWQHAREVFTIDDAAHTQREVWRHGLHYDLLRVLRTLRELGALEVFSGIPSPLFRVDLGDDPEDADAPLVPLPEDARERLSAALAPDAGPVDLVRLTPLGMRAVRERMLAHGRVAPLVGELASARPEQLLGAVAEHHGPETGNEEIANWIECHGGEGVAMPKLVDAIALCPFRSRAAVMLDVLAETRQDRTAWLRNLRADPKLAPLVVTALANEGVLDIEDLEPTEQLRGMAEQLIQALEALGPDAVRELVGSMGTQQLASLDMELRNSGHPDAAGLAELNEVLAPPPATNVRSIGKPPARHAPKRKSRKRKR